MYRYIANEFTKHYELNNMHNFTFWENDGSQNLNQVLELKYRTNNEKEMIPQNRKIFFLMYFVKSLIFLKKPNYIVSKIVFRPVCIFYRRTVSLLQRNNLKSVSQLESAKQESQCAVP